MIQGFIKQSNQNNLDESKAVWKALDRTLKEPGLNDDLITDFEFTEALSGLSKNTAPCPVQVTYPDIENLSEDDKASSSHCANKASEQDEGLKPKPVSSRTTRGVRVSTSAFLNCQQRWIAGLSLVWDLEFHALVCGMF